MSGIERSVQVVVSATVETIIRMEHFPVRCVLWRCNNALYAFLIIKRTNVLDTRKSLRCLGQRIWWQEGWNIKGTYTYNEQFHRVRSVGKASFFHDHDLREFLTSNIQVFLARTNIWGAMDSTSLNISCAVYSNFSGFLKIIVLVHN